VSMPEADRQFAIAYLERLANVMRGTSKECLICQAPVATWSQVGRCVYALPCQHRQYQGKIPRSRLVREPLPPRPSGAKEGSGGD
jgi:hypothetical protein